METEIKRICTTCKCEKELTSFGKRSGKVKYKYGRNSVCKACKSEYEKNRVMSNPDKKKKLYEANKKWRDSNKGRYRDVIFPSKWKNLGISFTKEDYETLLVKQQGVCAICKNEERRKDVKIRLSVDHCHITNKVRGLLCGNCNRAIGLLKDDPSLLIQASKYLTN